MVGVVLFTRVALPPCGYCLKASMTAPPVLSAPVDSRLRGNDGHTPYPSGLRIKSAMT